MARDLAPHASADVIARAVRLAQACNRAGAFVINVHVAFAADGADRLGQPVDEAMAAAFAPGWSDFVAETEGFTSDLVVTKRQWGAFHGTELDLQLRRRGIDTVLLCGVATNIGVEQTAREAWQLGYGVVLIEDATSSFDPAMHAFSIDKIMPRIARVRSVDAAVAALAPLK